MDNYGKVIVADRQNNRIVLLSPSLTNLGYIAVPGHHLKRPYSLHLDVINRRLYVGEGTGEGTGRGTGEGTNIARVFVFGVE